MLQVDNEKVYIEHCQGCSTHSWCTKHDESKYKSYFENCKAKILVICPEVQVVANQIPLAFRKKFSMGENSKPWEGKHSYPRIGAFEIYFKETLVFSKLESGLWPQSTMIANKIRDLLDLMRKPLKAKEISHGSVLKKRHKNKVKPRNIKSIEPNSSRHLSRRGKSSTPRRNFHESEVFGTDTSLYKKKPNKPLLAMDDNDEYSDDFKEESIEKNNRNEQDFIGNREVTKVYELTLSADTLSNKVLCI